MKHLVLIFVLISIGVVYGRWFMNDQIIGGDWPFYYAEFLTQLPLIPPSWSPVHGNGLGSSITSYGIDLYMYATIFISSKLHIPWEFVYKITWFGAFIIASVFSILYLLRRVLENPSSSQLAVGALIFTCNTYILMIAAGGQMGVALSYAISPLVITTFINVLEVNIGVKGILDKSVKYSLYAGLVLSLQLLLDPRIAYISIFAASVYFLVRYITARTVLSFRRVLAFFIIPLGIAVLVNAFWILPYVQIPAVAEGIPGTQSEFESLKFFSFANFSDTISLLHPNWPENIFGKIFFMRPEFLIFPLIAFLSLILANKSKTMQKSYIIFFSILALIGSFLAKGVNNPFGYLYYWFFQNIPGFNLFRDPSKWYVIVSIAYAVLISYALASFLSKPKNSQKSYVRSNTFLAHSVFLLFIVVFLLLIRQASMQSLSGTFEDVSISKEYIELKNLLEKDLNFYRTLWIPKQHRFTYYSYDHPSIEAATLFKEQSYPKVLDHFKKNNTAEVLSAAGIKYVIIPHDPFGEIFIRDRKYSQEERDRYEKELDKIAWLKKVQDGNLTIYQTNFHKDHFSINGNGEISYFQLEPHHYKVVMDIDEPVVITFSENYNPLWKGEIGEERIIPQHNIYDMQSYPVNKTGMYVMDVIFEGDKYYVLGRWISGMTIIVLIVLLSVLKLKKL